MPSVGQSLFIYSRRTLGKLLLTSVLIALLPIPADYYLGTGGEILFAPIAPVLVLIASGLVFVSWGLLKCLVWLLAMLKRFIPRRLVRIFTELLCETYPIFSRKPLQRREENSVRRSTIVSMVIILASIFLFVPWQVAYLGCWVIHLNSCASSDRRVSRFIFSPDPAISTAQTSDNGTCDKSEHTEVQNHEAQRSLLAKDRLDSHNHAMHLLLIMTWLLPLVAPVLVVWARTLSTAGFTTPFDSDHDFLNVAPFLVLVDFASRYPNKLLEGQE